MKDQDLFELNTIERRLKTFKKWQYVEPQKCTKEKMAAAGFYFIGSRKEPDLVSCFVCMKELDGWEEGDDPWEEHKSHASHCQFIQMNKSEEEMSYHDMRQLEMHRQMNRVAKMVGRKILEFKKQADKSRDVIEAMG